VLSPTSNKNLKATLRVGAEFKYSGFTHSSSRTKYQRPFPQGTLGWR